MKITAIALNTFREAVRDRILYLLLFFAVAGLVFSRFLALITVGDRLRIILDVGLASISIFGVLMAILMGTGLVYKEIDKRTVYTLLSTPIHRYQFLLGKFLGLILTLLIMVVLMSIIFFIIVWLHGGTVGAPMLTALIFIFLELVLITAVAMMFSCFSTPILSSIYSLAFYLIGHLSWGLQAFLDKMDAGLDKAVVQVVYVILPDLENFNFRTEVVHDLPIPSSIFLPALGYGLLYSAFLLFLAVAIFRKRDFI
jgi:ABC-type transport system involved in multi-copper enzyme maturation permease subunit